MCETKASTVVAYLMTCHTGRLLTGNLDFYPDLHSQEAAKALKLFCVCAGSQEVQPCKGVVAFTGGNCQSKEGNAVYHCKNSLKISECEQYMLRQLICSCRISMNPWLRKISNDIVPTC